MGMGNRLMILKFKLRKAVKISLAVKNWNMEDLAKAQGKKLATVNSAIYNGNPTLHTLENLAKDFGLNLSEFIKLGEDQ